ncbi:undecaprenyl/decaprenyl-phosphate alpha-N-acetylglucosaminyl 1-phosphate transferase [Robertmurraya yapensis]|uniref:Undecaprenyl/decaprenyl-phosphate alpha-N-acetylglucosaminyl 1-phosphate transferase n=2 Tax=Bacillus yapensis TaxID=2492960 RepID=A0A3S0K632_9BACI|nr:undecaprenyl/decaprenyl-phosphate alpha-N-acetylglucosaminyl 1-phosphate transferase [Bacillus yapensis]TKT05903.1 undecaprenyl/decaprenyl-phosphate alpha-N-acetylglucosaminyl 1-phosphate transferase [Bacillus yapensis]
MNMFISFLISFATTVILTPFIINLSYKIGAIDLPNERKVHQGGIPRIGGLAIIIGFLVGAFYLNLDDYSNFNLILISVVVILITGILDDIYNIKPIYKFAGQLLAALLVVAVAELKIEYVILPNNFKVDFGFYSYFITLFWILALINSINFIDGLDGLAAGVSIIALGSILYLSLINNQTLVIALATVVIGCTLGFLLFNFHPAKIFMGDTGSQFLGFIIAIISIIGFYKSVTIFSLFIPIIILGVPLFDTFFAIMRRLLSKKGISQADRSHIHHKLLDMGFSHRESVLIIYFTCIIFSAIAISSSRVTLWQSFIIFIIFIIILQLLAEFTGLLGKKQIFLSFFKKILFRNK